ncbi:MAG: lipoprotein [Methylococcaceae bacterium]|nr:lipoprotein [Methylococcaceae bacterium]
MIRIERTAWLFVSAFLLFGCGQKGPLYMEGREPRSSGKAQAPRQAPAQQAPEVEPSAPN